MKLGKAFSDNVIIEKKTQSRFSKTTRGPWWLGAGRALMFAIILFIALFILSLRLFELTIIQGHTYRAWADENRTKELIRHAPRGILYDRTGMPLVANIPHFRLLKPCEKNTAETCVDRLTKEEGEDMQKKGLPNGNFLEVDYQRQYLYPEATAHVVGYTGEITEDELKDDYYVLRKYGRGDRIGRIGAEAVFEDRLRGRDGKELIEVDAAGKIIRTLGRDNEVSGEDITLSLDAKLSQVARDAFPKGQKGAVVVTKPDTGEVLVLYSSPSFSNNEFASGMSASEYDDLVNDPARPMFDRAIGGVYPPGSTFKLVTSIAGIEEGVIRKDTLVEDTGVIKIGPYSFPNWYFLRNGGTEGLVNVVKALQRSNDIYFYKIGEALGIDRLAKWAKRVGIGKPLGIELSGEAEGLMPDAAWKVRHFTDPADVVSKNNLWYLGDTYHVAIGQGYLLTTPLQVNAWTNVVASGGKLCRPTILKIDGKYRLADCRDIGINKDTLPPILTGMKKACEPGGTGYPLFDFKIPKPELPDDERQRLFSVGAMATASGELANKYLWIPVECKTGTAEFGDTANNTHAWFTAFAPSPPDPTTSSSTRKIVSGVPEISVTVLVEGAGEGSDVAAPVARKIFEEWFSR